MASENTDLCLDTSEVKMTWTMVFVLLFFLSDDFRNGAVDAFVLVLKALWSVIKWPLRFVYSVLYVVFWPVRWFVNQPDTRTGNLKALAGFALVYALIFSGLFIHILLIPKV